MRHLWLLLLLASCASNNHQVHWGYDGETAPQNWSKLSKDFAKCEQGEYQTPIDLVLKNAKEINEDIDFDYEDSKATITNNGHTIQFNFNEENSLEINDKDYYLKQFHFHTKSEHLLNGKEFPGEMHLVHASKNGELTVVGFFLEIAKGNEEAITFFDKIPNEGEEVKDVKVNLAKLISDKKPHFYYQGSLTTPPCSENVHWIVFDKPLKVKKADFDKFVKHYPHNKRNVQGLKKHTLFHSTI